jgi:hypothetical protein
MRRPTRSKKPLDEIIERVGSTASDASQELGLFASCVTGRQLRAY